MSRSSSIEGLPQAIREEVRSSYARDETIASILARLAEQSQHVSRSAITRDRKKWAENQRDQASIRGAASVLRQELGDIAETDTGQVLMSLLESLMLQAAQKAEPSLKDARLLALALRSAMQSRRELIEMDRERVRNGEQGSQRMVVHMPEMPATIEEWESLYGGDA